MTVSFHAHDILEQVKLQGQKAAEWPPGTGHELITNGCKEPFCEDEHVINHDFGSDYMTVCICKSAWNCKITKVSVFFYLNILGFKNTLGTEI